MQTYLTVQKILVANRVFLEIFDLKSSSQSSVKVVAQKWPAGGILVKGRKRKTKKERKKLELLG